MFNWLSKIRDWLGLADGKVDGPAAEHEMKPVDYFAGLTAFHKGMFVEWFDAWFQPDFRLPDEQSRQYLAGIATMLRYKFRPATLTAAEREEIRLFIFEAENHCPSFIKE